MFLLAPSYALISQLAIGLAIRLVAAHEHPILMLLAELVAQQHFVRCLAPLMREHYVRLRLEFEYRVATRLAGSHWSELRRSIEKQKQDALWPVVNFNYAILDTAAILLPQMGHLTWLATHYPAIIAVLVVVLIVAVATAKPPKHDMDAAHRAWSLYEFHYCNRVVDRIHNRTGENTRGILSAVHAEEAARSAYRESLLAYNQRSESAHWVVFALFATCVSGEHMARYIHCAYGLGGAGRAVANLYMSAREAQHHSRALEAALAAPRPPVAAVPRVDFASWQSKSVLISGSSGSGKSTFLDWLVDQLPHRVYAEQNPEVCWAFPVGEIVSFKGDLALARRCLDLVGAHYDLDKVGLSGGEKAQALLARALYLLMSAKHKERYWLILDEADRAISPDKLLPAFTRVQDYCRSNGVTLVVVAHTAVRDLTWDLRIVFFFHAKKTYNCRERKASSPFSAKGLQVSQFTKRLVICKSGTAAMDSHAARSSRLESHRYPSDKQAR